MKEQLADILLRRVKIDIAQRCADFYVDMREGLEDGEDYMTHFAELGRILAQIDSCESIEALAMIHGSGELDFLGFNDFSEFIYDLVLTLGK